MGRPQKEKKDKRCIKVSFRITEQEKEYLNKLEWFSNLSTGEVIRELVFKNRLLQPKIPLLDQQAYLELKRIGNNVNQIAKHLNGGQVGKIPLDEFEKLADGIQLLLKKVINGS